MTTQRDHKAGNGEDEIFLVLRQGREEVHVRNRVNASLLAREHTRKEAEPAVVFNIDTREFVLVTATKEALPSTLELDVAMAELKKVKAEIVGAKKQLAAIRKAG